ncbi:MAG: hypothetical protein MI741_18990 [Rhodospirillales bacterium]|nr:hypothetical protein [Rhodospirillales bacterium]
MQIPLPEGEWVLVGLREYSINGPFASGVLARFDGDTVFQLTSFDVPLSWGPGYVASKLCERDDVHFTKRKANQAGGNQDCWIVNHWRMTGGGQRLPLQWDQALEYAVENGISVPINMMTVEYRRATSHRMMNVNYFFNPEAEGFPPPKYADWSTSDWHRDRARLDPKRAAYIETIKAWGEAWKVQVDAGFDGKLPTSPQVETKPAY